MKDACLYILRASFRHIAQARGRNVFLPYYHLIDMNLRNVRIVVESCVVLLQYHSLDFFSKVSKEHFNSHLKRN